MLITRRLSAILIAAALALCAAIPASAQAPVPGATVYSISPSKSYGTTQTLTAQTAATVTSSAQVGFGIRNIVCSFTQSTYTGSPSTTFSIQNRDPVTGTYYSTITSAAITTSTSPSAIASGSSVGTVANVSAGFPVTPQWRTTVTVGGTSTPTVTATVNCSAAN